MLQRLNRGLALVLALLGSACGEVESVCLADCLQGFEVAFDSPAPLPDGGYEVEVTLPDEAFVCSRTFPADDTVPDAECGPESRVYVTSTQAPLEEATGLVISTLETPETIGVTIRHEGVVLTSETFTPAYQRSTICGSSCSNARERVTLPALTRGDAGVSDAE